MTKNVAVVAHRHLDRAPIIGDIVTVTPLGERLFDVIALDDLYREFIYAAPQDGEQPAQWYSLTYVRVIDDEPAEADTCHCGHPDCGSC